METLAFNWANGPSILHMLVEHLQIVAVGVGFAILTGVPLGIAISLNERVARVVLYVAAILMTGAVGRAVRLVNPGTVTDWARHRSLAGCDRTFPLFAIAKSKLISINATLGSPLVVPESALIGQQRMGQTPLP